MAKVTITYEAQTIDIPEFLKLKLETELPKQISISGYVFDIDGSSIHIEKDSDIPHKSNLPIEDKFNKVFIPEYLLGKRKFCTEKSVNGKFDLHITKDFDFFENVSSIDEIKATIQHPLKLGSYNMVKIFLEYFDKYTFEMFVNSFSESHPHTFPIKGCLSMVSENCDKLSRKDLEEVCIQRLDAYSEQNKIGETHLYNLKELVLRGIEVFYTHFKK